MLTYRNNVSNRKLRKVLVLPHHVQDVALTALEHRYITNASLPARDRYSVSNVTAKGCDQTPVSDELRMTAGCLKFSQKGKWNGPFFGCYLALNILHE